MNSNIKFSKDFINDWNRKYFPLDYLTDSSFLKGLKTELNKYYESTIPDKQTLKKTLKKYEKGNFSGLDTNEKEGKIIINSILSHYEIKERILPIAKYYYLYLEHGWIPVLPKDEKDDLFGILGIEDISDFSKQCFDTGIFGNFASQVEIKKYLTEYTFDYLDKIVNCWEKINNENLIVLYEKDWPEQNSNVLKSILDNRVFNLANNTRIIYLSDNTWKQVKYLNINTKDEKTYLELGEPHKIRLKTLIDDIYSSRISNSIHYEPSDIGRELPKIKVNVGEKEHEFLVGSTYNLYLADEPNKIVGKIDVISIGDNNGKANIHWIEGYPGLL